MKSTRISRVKKKISPKNRHECDQEITVAETKRAIKYFESNKLPNNGGLPAELYETFYEILKTDQHKLYIDIYRRGEIARSMRWAVISCLYKKGDREDITNWCPISLLN